MFMSKEPPVKRTLADIIMEKITEKQTEIRTQMSGKNYRETEIGTQMTGKNYRETEIGTQMSGQDLLVSSFLKAPAAIRLKYC